MTIVIAMQDGDVVLMGSDSASTDENFDRVIRKGASKMWMQSVAGLGNMCVGFCGQFSIGMWIRFGFEWPKKSWVKRETVEAWLVRDVQPALLKSISKRFKHEEEEVRSQWELVVALPGQMFKLQSCGNVESTSDSFLCIGDAASIANGALHVLQKCDVLPWEAMDVAFEACTQTRASVCSPFHIMTLGHHVSSTSALPPPPRKYAGREFGFHQENTRYKSSKDRTTTTMTDQTFNSHVLFCT